jgi:hypothetical protein
MSFTAVFSGDVINPAPSGLNALTLNADTVLSWPTQFQNGNDIASNILDVLPTANGFTLTMPNATQISVGQSVLINNTTAFSFTLNKNDNTLLTVINATSLVFIYLFTNKTLLGAPDPGGTWRASPFGGGATAVTFVAATSNNSNITISGSPITVAGTFSFDLFGNLLSLSGLTPPGGITALTAANTFDLRTITGTGNQIVVLNGDGVVANPVISLDPNITGLTSLQVGNFAISGNTISALNVNGHVSLVPFVGGSIDIVNPNVPGNVAYSSLISGSLNTGPASNIALRLPVTAPLAGQVMTALSAISPYPLGWQTVATILGGASVDAIPRFANIGGSLKDSAVYIDDNNNLSIGSLISPAGLSRSITLTNINNANYVSLFSSNPVATYKINLPTNIGAANTLIYSTDGLGQIEFTNNAITVTGIGRAWGAVTGAGVLSNGYNIASSRTSAGVYPITLAVPFNNTNYVVNITAKTTAGIIPFYTIVDASNFVVNLTNTAAVATDSDFSVSCHGN